VAAQAASRIFLIVMEHSLEIRRGTATRKAWIAVPEPYLNGLRQLLGT
jgi:hypothetical protein